MPRIRTIKPEFWEDDVVGTLSWGARLAFIASFNLADDEGILRWTSAYIESQVFMYDNVTLEDVAEYMGELVNAELVFPYQGGRAKQRLALIVHFHRHQKINRPTPSRFTAPSLQSPAVRAMYARRDRWTCHLCGLSIPESPGRDEQGRALSVDHVRAASAGGSDHPSNVRAAHLSCNKSRGNRPLTSDDESHTEQVMTTSLNGSVSHSRNGSPPDQGTGIREGEHSPSGSARAARAPARMREAPDVEFPNLPATVRTNSTGPNDVVAAWVEATQLNGVSPTARSKGMVAKEAKSLLDSGNDPDRVLKAAIDAGTKGFPNLERELMAMSGRAIPKRITNKPTRDDKVRALLELAQREEARNAE